MATAVTMSNHGMETEVSELIVVSEQLIVVWLINSESN